MTQVGGVDNDPNISSSAADHGIQAYIELVYIRQGNEMITNSMSTLKDALSTTKNALDNLAGLQQMHNTISVKNRTSFTEYAKAQGFSFNKSYSTEGAEGKDDSDAYMKAYVKIASEYYNRPISPFFGVGSTEWTASSPEFQKFATDMGVYRGNVITIMKQLSGQMTADQLADPNSLYQKLNTVLGTLPDPPTFDKCKAWVMDAYDQQTGPKGTINVSTDAGKNQQYLDNAVTAAQSLNDSQKEDVQRFLKVYEEYYKSASAILTAITQIIQKMASHIAR